MSGAFKIGDKLPTERELCEQFGVSRAPIRQALSALEMNGVIYSRQGEGVYVKNNQLPSAPSDQLLESISPEQIMEARMNIEPLIIKTAAERATEEDIELLRTAINKMEEETKSGEYVPETDEAFHLGIANATHNDLYIKIMTDILHSMKYQKVGQSIRIFMVNRPDDLDVNYQEHVLLFKAIKEHNVEEAVKIMKDHMDNVMNLLTKIDSY